MDMEEQLRNQQWRELLILVEQIKVYLKENREEFAKMKKEFKEMKTAVKKAK